MSCARPSSSDLGVPRDALSLGWAGIVPLEEMLAAARRQFRCQAGWDLPAWGEPDTDSAVWPAEPAADDVPHAGPAAAPPPGSAAGPSPGSLAGPARASAADRPPSGPSGGADPPTADDPFAEDELRAAADGADQAASQLSPLAGRVTGDAVPVTELGGHARLAPGPGLASWLSFVAAGQLDDAALANSITGWRKVTSWAQAQELAAVAELARRRGAAVQPGPDRSSADQLQADFAPNEIALALTLTGNAADYWMSFAVSLHSRLPGTWAALAAGQIDLARAKLIDQFTAVLDDGLARLVEARVLPRAERQTTGQLRASLSRAVLSVDPAAAERRRKEAERHARVELAGEPEGTASLLGRFLPAAQASAAWARIDVIARALQDAGAAGGIDLLRAQVLLRLLLGQPPAVLPEDEVPGGPDPAGSPPAAPGQAGPGPAGPGQAGPGPAWTGSGGCDPAGPGPAGPAPAWTGSGGCDPAGPGRAGPFPQTEDAWPDPSFAGPVHSLGAAVPGLGQALGRALGRRAVLGVPWRTLAGLIEEPGQLGRIGPVTAAVARQLAAAAAVDSTCEWQVIVVDARGSPVVVTTIRPPGPPRATLGRPRVGPVGQPRVDSCGQSQAGPSCSPRTGSPRTEPSGRPLAGPLRRLLVTVPVDLPGARTATPPVGRESEPGSTATPGLGPGPLASMLGAALRAAGAALRRVTETVEVTGNDGRPGPAGDHCTHARAVPAYRVPASMRVLIEARDQDCGFPLCRRPAAACDLDHTIPYDQGGLTCPCNVYPHCRRHHRLKGLRTWHLAQPSPGQLIWRTPAALTYRSGPTGHPW